MCESGLPNSVLEIENFWRRTSYNIGGYTFSLDDIEHGILRGKTFVILLPFFILFHFHILHVYNNLLVILIQELN